MSGSRWQEKHTGGDIWGEARVSQQNGREGAEAGRGGSEALGWTVMRGQAGAG